MDSGDMENDVGRPARPGFKGLDDTGVEKVEPGIAAAWIRSEKWYADDDGTLERTLGSAGAMR